jgi:hypothetical protein
MRPLGTVERATTTSRSLASRALIEALAVLARVGLTSALLPFTALGGTVRAGVMRFLARLRAERHSSPFAEPPRGER